MHLSRTGKAVIFVSVIWCIGSVVLFACLTSFRPLLSIPFNLAFFTAIIAGVVLVFIDWRRYSWRSVLPLASCVIAIFLSGILVDALRQRVHQHQFAKLLPAYEGVVHEIENGSIPVSAKLKRLPQAISNAPLAYAVLAVMETNGIVSVEFLTESGFPLKHGGYLYVSSGVVAPGSVMDGRWPMRQRVRGK